MTSCSPSRWYHCGPYRNLWVSSPSITRSTEPFTPPDLITPPSLYSSASSSFPTRLERPKHGTSPWKKSSLRCPACPSTLLRQCPGRFSSVCLDDGIGKWTVLSKCKIWSHSSRARVLLIKHRYAFSLLFAVSAELESVGTNNLMGLWLKYEGVRTSYPLHQPSGTKLTEQSHPHCPRQRSVSQRNYYPLGLTSVAIVCTIVWVR